MCNTGFASIAGLVSQPQLGEELSSTPMGYSRGHRCTLVLAASIVQRSNHSAIAFVPGPRSLALQQSRRHICRQQYLVINWAVRKRAPVLRSAVVVDEAGVLDRNEGDSLRGRSSLSAPVQPKKVSIAKGKARLFWYGYSQLTTIQALPATRRTTNNSGCRCGYGPGSSHVGRCAVEI